MSKWPMWLAKAGDAAIAQVVIPAIPPETVFAEGTGRMWRLDQSLLTLTLSVINVFNIKYR